MNNDDSRQDGQSITNDGLQAVSIIIQHVEIGVLCRTDETLSKVVFQSAHHY